MKLFLFLMMLGISFFDFRDFVIPDLFHLFLILGKIVCSDSFRDFSTGCLNGLSVALPLFLLRFIMNRILKQECMGGGDIKLVFSLGIYFDLFHDVMALLISCVLGLFVSLFYLKKQERIFPFGPCICGAFLIMFLLKERLF